MQRNDRLPIRHRIGSYVFAFKDPLSWGRKRTWGSVGWSTRDHSLTLTIPYSPGSPSEPSILVVFDGSGTMVFERFAAEMKDTAGKVRARAVRTGESLAVETPEGEPLVSLTAHSGPATPRDDRQEPLAGPFVFAAGARFWELSVWDGHGGNPANWGATLIP